MQKFISDIQSPCVRNCCLDAEDKCLGCGRLLEEILQWGSAPASRQQEIRRAAARRVRQSKVKVY